MTKYFEKGQKLKGLYFHDGTVIEVNVSYSFGMAIDIEVIMECGQMAGVPWAYVRYKDGTERKFNLALIEGVKL